MLSSRIISRQKGSNQKLRQSYDQEILSSTQWSMGPRQLPTPKSVRIVVTIFPYLKCE